MDNLIYVLFICVAAPMLIMTALLKKSSRALVGYMLIGFFVSLVISEVNELLVPLFDNDVYYITTVISPITEEIIKALPVLVYAIFISDKREKVIPLAFATGLGFAMFENIVVFVQNLDTVSIDWAIIRGFSTALMHGVCTGLVGIGMCYIRNRKKLFFSGTFALLVLAVIYHGIFNMLAQSDYKYFGFILPVVTFIPILLKQYRAIFNIKHKNSSSD
ncbi:MAG: PrsW family glutamic-type intramembrane protease [Ruminococcus sp.]|nr:PrsW family glutamic-type intramembrane protease [Ruminococcus sp.]